MQGTRYIEQAQKYRWYRWLLSRQLNRKVPFNAPHRLRVCSIALNEHRLELPLRKRNCNHLGSLHACALATLAEASSGFLLILRLDAKRYRLILQRLEMDYHYRAETSATGVFRLDESWLQREVYAPLEQNDAVTVACQTEIFDRHGNKVATGVAHWQIKAWQKVGRSK